MGTSRSPEELAAKLTRFGRGMPPATREGVRIGALLVATSIRRELQRAAPSGRLSGVGRRGARLSVGFDPPKSDTNPTALVRARGPWQLIENPTRPHEIVPKRRRRTRNRRPAVLTPQGPRTRIMHPGTRGKHPWERGVRSSEHLVRQAVQREFHHALVKAFR